MDQAAFARALHKTDQVVTNWKRRGLPTKMHAKVAALLGISIEELIGAPPLVRLPKGAGVAQSLSHLTVTVLPTIKWEALVDLESLPDEFSLAAPDDAMAPLARAGRLIVWNRQREARPGAGILVRDRAGQFHLRQMHQGREPGHFRAVPLNSAYRELDSAADGLEVVAVWDGLRGGLEDMMG